jgi:hypothetical protein
MSAIFSDKNLESKSLWCNGSILTNSMEKSPSSQANSCSVVKKFPTFYGTERFIIMFTRSHHWYDSVLVTENTFICNKYILMCRILQTLKSFQTYNFTKYNSLNNFYIYILYFLPIYLCFQTFKTTMPMARINLQL